MVRKPEGIMDMSQEEFRRLALLGKNDKLELLFLNTWLAEFPQLPVPERQFRHNPNRKWRWDYAFPEQMVLQVGVVDPYLECRVSRGQWFYLLLNPGSITAMHHEWQHPQFPITAGTPPHRSVSEEWLIRFCADRGADYEELVEGASSGRGCVFSTETDGDECGPEFLEHVQNVTGRTFGTLHRATTKFRCSC